MHIRSRPEALPGTQHWLITRRDRAHAQLIPGLPGVVFGLLAAGCAPVLPAGEAPRPAVLVDVPEPLGEGATIITGYQWRFERQPEEGAADAVDCTWYPLDAGAIYPEDAVVEQWEWALQSRPEESTATNAMFENRDQSVTAFFPDVAGEYLISLAARGPDGWLAPELIVVDVFERDHNSAPTIEGTSDTTLEDALACCPSGGGCETCDDVEVFLGEGITLYDPDGDPLTVQWSRVSGGAEVVDEHNLPGVAVLAGAVPDEAGACVSEDATFLLVVTDCPGQSVSAVVLVESTCCGVSDADCPGR